MPTLLPSNSLSTGSLPYRSYSPALASFSASSRAALRRFGAHPETKVREAVWFSKLEQFAPAGFGTTGPALPPYLLDRGKPSAAPEAEESSGDDESSSGDSDEESVRYIYRYGSLREIKL